MQRGAPRAPLLSSDYDAVQWHMHGWKRPGQKLSLHYAVRHCDKGTQGQAAGSGTRDAPPGQDRGTQHAVRSTLAAQGDDSTQGQATGSGAPDAPPELDGEARRRVQSALAAQGFDPGLPDGKFGSRTRGAIQAWQQANGYEATGELTSGQAERLLAAENPPGSAGVAATKDIPGSTESSIRFPCEDGQQEIERLKWDIQNYQEYSQDYKGSTHLLWLTVKWPWGTQEVLLKTSRRLLTWGRL